MGHGFLWQKYQEEFFPKVWINTLKFSFVPQNNENFYEGKNNIKIKRKTNIMIWIDNANQRTFSSNSTFTSVFCQGEFHLHVLHDSLEALSSGCLMLEQEQHPGISFATTSDMIFFCISPRRKDSAHFSCSCFCLSETTAYAIRFSQCIFCVFPKSRIRYDLYKQSAIIITNHIT